MAERSVVFGAQGLCSPDWAGRGVGRYSARLIEGVQQAASDWNVGIDLGARAPAVQPRDLDDLAECPPVVDPGARPAAGRVVYHVLAPFERGSVDRVWPPWARAADVALVVTAHDLIPWRHPDHYLSDPTTRHAYRQRLELLRVADVVCATSESVRRDLIALAGVEEERVRVTGAGPSREAAAPGCPLPGHLEETADRAVLAVLGEDHRKNVDRLLGAYGLLDEHERARMPLLLCGLDPDRIRTLPAGAQVLPWMPGSELATLQRRCRATIHPAFDEGFGLPVLDALVAGGAVLVSDIPVLAELVPDPGARFDPLSLPSMAAALRRLHDDRFVTGLRERAATWAAPHTWAAAAARTLEAYDLALARRTARPRRRPHVAVITPLPPQRTGIAVFERHRLEALARIADVDAFPDERAGVPLPEVPGVRVLPSELAAPAAAIEGYDAPILHVIGNSRFHVRAWQHLMRHGGDVLLHDVRLVGLYDSLFTLGLVDTPQTDRSPRAGLQLCGDVMDRARRVFVHTAAARRLVLEERPDRADDVRVVPLGIPAHEPSGTARRRTEVATFGFVKDGERLAQMLAALISRDRAVRGVIVGGEANPGDEAWLRGRLDDLGVATEVQLTGWVDEQAWHGRLRTATVAVQLRESWNGESSGTVLECLACGLPTIVSDNAGAEELPDSAVVKVAPQIDPESLADIVADLLADEDRRASLAVCARAYARSQTMPLAASALLEAMLSPSEGTEKYGIGRPGRDGRAHAAVSPPSP